MAERTGCPALSSLWSYVIDLDLNGILFSLLKDNSCV